MVGCADPALRSHVRDVKMIAIQFDVSGRDSGNENMSQERLEESLESPRGEPSQSDAVDGVEGIPMITESEEGLQRTAPTDDSETGDTSGSRRIQYVADLRAVIRGVI